MNTKVLLLTDLESKIEDYSITHSTWISSIRELIGVGNVTTIDTNEGYQEVLKPNQIYDFVIILAELTWYSGLSIQQQVDRRFLDGFYLIEDLRKKHHFNKSIFVVSMFPKSTFWTKGSIVIKSGSILQESFFHPFFHLTEHDILTEIKRHIQSQPLIVREKRLEEICSEYFTLEGIVRIFFHDIGNPKGEINEIEELKLLKEEIKSKDAAELVSEIEKFFRDYPNPTLPDILLLKDRLLPIAIHFSETQERSFDFSRLGSVLYIEDEDSWQNRVQKIFIKRKLPASQFLTAKSWEESYKLLEERNLSISSVSSKGELTHQSELINTVIVDAKLLNEAGEKQLYQGVDIIEELEALGYFSVIVLSQSDKLLFRNVVQNRSILYGFNKEKLSDRVGIDFFWEKVMENAKLVFIEKQLVPYTDPAWNSAEGDKKLNVRQENGIKVYVPFKQNYIDYSKSTSSASKKIMLKYTKDLLETKTFNISEHEEIFSPSLTATYKINQKGESTYERNHLKLRLLVIGAAKKKPNEDLKSLARCLLFPNETILKNVIKRVLQSNTYEEILQSASGYLYSHEVFFLKNYEKL